MASPSGFFQGGFAEGSAAADERAIKREENAADGALRSRAVGVAERNAGTAERSSRITEVTERISSTMKVIGSAIEAAKAAGQPPERIAAGIRGPLEDVATFSAMIGRDPSATINLVKTMIGTPGAPATDLGKLQADLRNGYITQEEYAAKSKAITTPNSSTTNVNVGGEKAFVSELGKKSAESFLERQSAARDAVASIQSTDEAIKLLNSGAFTGVGADYLVQAGKGLQRLGITFADDAIKNTEAFAATRAQEVGRIIKLFGAGTGLSDQDRAYATRAAAGDITLSEQSIRKILDINSRAARNVIARYNAEAAQVDPNVVPFDLRVAEPANAPAEVKRKTIGGKNYINQNGAWFEE